MATPQAVARPGGAGNAPAPPAGPNIRSTMLMMLAPMAFNYLVLPQYKKWQEGGFSTPATAPPLAQVINPIDFAVIGSVKPPAEQNATTIFVPPGHTMDSLNERPFHIYDPAFYSVIGKEPTLTVVSTSASDPLFHEAPVWYPPTDEMFFSQNAGALAAGTGLKKSSIVQKVSLKECDAVKDQREARVDVHVVRSEPEVKNPNGAINFNGQLLFTAEGQGHQHPPALVLMNPVPPYNTTTLLDNFFGRQFNSVNDLAIHPVTKEVYFTDPLYGFWQDFRPKIGLRKSVWRFNSKTGLVSAVADGMDAPNGIAFSPDAKYLYVADTGFTHVFHGVDHERPASIYRYTVEKDGSLTGQMLFAYTESMVPDGVHVDTKGNVYAGCGDGVQVWNPAGKLIGKIFTGMLTANFQFAGNRMIILCETKLFYATLGIKGVDVTGL